jgi:hypothetical protein
MEINSVVMIKALNNMDTLRNVIKRVIGLFMVSLVIFLFLFLIPLSLSSQTDQNINKPELEMTEQPIPSSLNFIE